MVAKSILHNPRNHEKPLLVGICRESDHSVVQDFVGVGGGRRDKNRAGEVPM